MRRNDDLMSKGFYAIIILILAWGILGALYLGAKEFLAVIGHLTNWEFGQQFYDGSKGIGIHLFTGIFLFTISGFLIWMGRKFLNWINEDYKTKKAKRYKRRNYR